LVVQAQSFQTVSLSAVANAHYQNWYTNLNVITPPPAGSVILGNVPFFIPADGNNCWSSSIVANSGMVSVDIPVDEYGVKYVDTLMNSIWGQVGPKTKIEFFGSNNSYFAKNITGNVDIRDFNNNTYTNSINETTTTQVWSSKKSSGGWCRLDKQFIELPNVFQAETLEYIRISDWGSKNNRVLPASVKNFWRRVEDCKPIRWENSRK
jgi:hypothetical protein